MSGSCSHTRCLALALIRNVWLLLSYTMSRLFCSCGCFDSPTMQQADVLALHVCAGRQVCDLAPQWRGAGVL
eukprot:974451-Pelagomonas_calceolata.AAC.1